MSVTEKTTAERIAIVAMLALIFASGLIAFNQIQRLRAHTVRIESSYKLLSKLDELESLLKAAETQYRGYITTDDKFYLGAYRSIELQVTSLLADHNSLQRGDPNNSEEIARLSAMINERLKRNAIRMENRAEQADAGDLAKEDAVYLAIDSIRKAESERITERELTAATTYWVALLTVLLSTVCGLVLVVAVLYLVQYNRCRAELAAKTIRDEHDRLRASLDRNTLLEIENRRMDEYMRTIVEQVQDYAIFGMDSECRATTWNEGVRQVLGFDEAEFIGHDIRQLIFTPEAIELGIPAAEFETAAKEGSASDDRWMMRKCGKRFWASGITSAVKQENGELIGFSKVMRDLTEQKRDEDELAKLAAELSETNRRKNEFLATLAHELRNPLAPIKNAIDLMGMSQLSVEHEELRAIVARQVDQVIGLIDDLLDISRIERGKISLQRRIVDLRTVIESAVEASSAAISEKSQILEVNLCDQEVRVDVDPTRVVQVFSNLLNNSSRYSDNNSQISLTLALEFTEQVGVAVVAIKDNGIGIAPDRLEEIFQMFAQIEDSLGRGNAGLGIGLTLVKTLVELHGGTVAAQSDGVGCGSQFVVRLPLTSANAIASPTEPIAEAPIFEKSFKVLVVEDMQALRMIMSRLLEKLGHQVRVAEDGLEALDVLTAFTPDIIFSDIAMPGMTGFDFARKLRELPDFSKTYLVAMSGYGQLSDRRESRKSGFDEHMVKPVDFNKLRELFNRLSAGLNDSRRRDD